MPRSTLSKRSSTEEALAQATELRVLKAIGEAVPVRLMKRELLFVVERLSAVLDDRRLAIILRQHNLGKPNGATDAPAKLLSAFFRKADESTLGRILVELAVLQTAASPTESSRSLREAAEFYKVTWEPSQPRSSKNSPRRTRQRP